MSSPSIVHVNKDNFESEVLKSDKLVLIDFYADWCGPCKALGPTVEKFAEEHPDVKVVKVNVDDNPELCGTFGVRSIPLLVTMKDGAPIYGNVGNIPKETLEEFVTASAEKAKETAAPVVKKPNKKDLKP